MDITISFPDKESAQKFLRHVEETPDVSLKWVDEDFYYMYSTIVHRNTITFHEETTDEEKE
jgi:hypothetical protein